MSIDYPLYGVSHGVPEGEALSCEVTCWGVLQCFIWRALPSGDGEVYVWDLSSRRCVHKFTDEGCVLGTKVAVSPDGQRVACG